MIEHALELSPQPGPRAALSQFAGEVALARGDLPGAADSAAACLGALAGFGSRDQHHLPLARLETELYLAQDRAGDALAVARRALDRIDLPRSPRYAWPLLAAGAGACAETLSQSAAGRDRGLAEQARRLLDRLRDLAEKLNATGPVEEAHRLTSPPKPRGLARQARILASLGRGRAGVGSPWSSLCACLRAAARRRGRDGPRGPGRCGRAAGPRRAARGRARRRPAARADRIAGQTGSPRAVLRPAGEQARGSSA